MNIKDYLKEKQPIVYQTLVNTFKSGRISHAYMIDGCKGLPILDVAKLMAKSFLCSHLDENNLACLECEDCKLVDDNNNVDYKFVEGNNLKTDTTLDIQRDFNKTSIDNKKQIYIINNIEKSPLPSLNKLLKFIEEPNNNIIAIFTTNSKESVLQTITSRCQVISLKEFRKDELVKYLLDNNIEVDDAYLLANISNDSNKNLEIANSNYYPKVKRTLESSLNYLGSKDDYFIVDFQTNVINNLKDNIEVELFLDMLEVCLLQAIIKQENKNFESIFFDEPIDRISRKFNHIEKMIYDITDARKELLSNANKNLVFDKLAISLLRR